MSDEVVETTEPTQEPATEPTTEAPALTDEAVASYLGIPVEDVSKAKNVAELYKKANETNRRAKEYEKSLAERATPPAKQASGDDPYEGLDAEQAQLLRKLIRYEAEQLVSPLVYEQRATHQQEVVDVMSDFLTEHAKDGDFNPAAVDDALDEIGLRAVIENPKSTPKQVKTALEKAYKYVKASALDIDAEVEKRVAAALAESKGKGEEVINIKPKRSAVKASEKTLDDPNLSVDERASLVRQLLKQQ